MADQASAVDVVGEVDHDAFGVRTEGCGDEFEVEGGLWLGFCGANTVSEHGYSKAQRMSWTSWRHSAAVLLA
ncbi:hypothetical protein OG864_00285 [Streptomyces sp. NBC_00124]|uniref:hypothetical protein n=1 Tax=Streptomyces sp. NBC_00124 TaxID=2975662 RepID=UPI00225935EE|nr:hypothetical protein [Streptomyces sp. NBC_00124]MCX5357225.1 hypothetical protein [Streptomyces sp. NBC_00124]